MTKDGILSFEVTLTASSSDEVKRLIEDAKQIEETKRQEKEDLKSLKAKQRQEKQATKEATRMANMVELEDGRKVTKKQYDRMRERARIKQEKAEQRALDESIAQASLDAEEEAIDQVPEIENYNRKLKEMLDEIDSNGMNNLKQIATNPEGMIQNKLLTILGSAGPYGAIAAAIVGMVLASPELVKVIVEALAVKGGPLNMDFRFTLEEQLGQEFDRLVQFRRITGDNPIITTDFHGYVPGDENFQGNSLVDSEITRTARISIKQKSLMFTSGI